MNVKKIVMLFYLMYTVYILLICGMTSITVFDILPAVILIWIAFGIFSYGEKVAGKIKFKKSFSNYLEIDVSERAWILLSLISPPSAVIAAHFYTGLWPTEVISNLLNGISNYAHYQSYFAQNGIATAGIVKLPYILMLFWVKLVLLYGCVRIFLHQAKMTFKSILMVGVCVVPHFYVALARGTNFEYYEFMILMVYIILSKIESEMSLRKMGLKGLKSMGICLVLGVCLVVVFCIVLGARGYVLNLKITKDIAYNENSFLVQLLPGFSFIIVNLFDYLGFGLFYIASYINKVWFASLHSFFAGFFLKGYELLYDVSTKEIMKETIDVGVNWHPDMINCINEWGVIGLLALIGTLGFVLGKLYIYKDSIWKGISKYLIILQMLSFPIGNFLMCSSAYKLLIVMVSVILLLEKKNRELENG